MQFEGALIREQGESFAVVVVKRHILDNAAAANAAIRNFAPAFPGLPVVLMGQDGRGRATFFGRQDIARFLSRISIDRIPWQRFTI